MQKKIAITSPALYCSPVVGFEISFSIRKAPPKSPTAYSKHRTKAVDPTALPRDMPFLIQEVQAVSSEFPYLSISFCSLLLLMIVLNKRKD